MKPEYLIIGFVFALLGLIGAVDALAQVLS